MKLRIGIVLILFNLTITVFANELKTSISKNKVELKELIGQCSLKYKANQMDSALFYINAALDKAQHVQDSHLFLVCYNYKGVILKGQSKYNLCLQAYNDALRYLPKEEYNINRLKLLLNIAIVHRKQGQFSKALLVLDNTLKNSESYPKSKTLASCFDEFGMILKNEKSERALLFLNKALEMRKDLGNKRSIAKSYTNLGSFYNMRKNYSKALFYYKKSLELNEELKYRKSISVVCTNIGNLYLKIEKIDSAQIYYNRSLDIKEVIGDRNGEAVVCTSLGELYAMNKEYKKAENYLMRANRIAEEIEVLYLQQEINLQLKNLYAAQNKGKEALAYYDKYISIKDSIFNTENMQHMQEMETRYQTREKEQQIEVLNIEKEAKANESFYMKIVLGVFLFSLLPIGFFVKQRQKTRILKERVAASNRECTKLGMELHDSISGSLTYLCRSMEKESVGESFVDQLRQVSDEVRGISHQLNMTAIANQEFRDALSDSLQLDHFPEDIDLKIYVPDGFEIDDYEKKINLIRIVQELKTNSLKHGNASSIVISFSRLQNKVRLDYSDNGIGFDMKEAKKGNGLHNIQERVELLAGKLDWQTSPGNGLSFHLTV